MLSRSGESSQVEDDSEEASAEEDEIFPWATDNNFFRHKASVDFAEGQDNDSDEEDDVQSNDKARRRRGSEGSEAEFGCEAEVDH